MQFEWDDAKNKTNRSKHGISFETAILVFDDPDHLSIQDRYENGEERWQTLGRIAGTVILLVTHTYRDNDEEETIRVISARKATAHERRRYEQG